MTRSYISSATLFCALAIAGSAYAVQPPDVVTSDVNANTAMGTSVLLSTISGASFGNTGAGFQALYLNTIGSDNTAIGSGALGANTSGSHNTANGTVALNLNTTGGENTASGFEALTSNTTGNYNTASGYEALSSNTTGYRNEASGAWGLQSNTSGHDNTAAGHDALHSNTTGVGNIGVGANAGYYVTTGSDNIEIGASGTSGDNGKIRLGTQGRQTATYIAGISSTHVTGAAVYVTTTGQLGVLASSERFKTAVAPMGSTTARLKDLRPVTFQLKTHPKAGVQYGLIAEEVAKVYPELVIRGDQGQIEGVRYEELTPMLLNELQQQQARLADQQARLGDQEAELQDVRSQLADLRRAMQERSH